MYTFEKVLSAGRVYVPHWDLSGIVFALEEYTNVSTHSYDEDYITQKLKDRVNRIKTLCREVM